jgi:hypothetical protein
LLAVGEESIYLIQNISNMSYLLLNSHNAEVVIDDNCGISKFYAVANLLQDDLQISFLNQVDDIDLLNWDFSYKKKFLTLHYDIYGGVSIQESINNPKQDLVSRELGDYLHSRAY